MILALEELHHIYDVVIKALPQGGVIILEGDLAAGKTTLVKALVASFGINDSVSSPTFSLQQCYDDTLFHYDIYNHGFEHFLSLGMFEEFEKEGFHFVEWGDEKLVALLQQAAIETLHIAITFVDDAHRHYDIKKVV